MNIIIYEKLVLFLSTAEIEMNFKKLKMLAEFTDQLRLSSERKHTTCVIVQLTATLKANSLPDALQLTATLKANSLPDALQPTATLKAYSSSYALQLTATLDNFNWR